MCSSSVPAHPAAGRASGLPKRDLRSPCSTPVVPAPIGTTASTSAPSSLKYRDRAPEHIRKTRPIQQHCYACTEYNYDWFCNDLEEPYTAPTDKPFSWLGRMRIAGGRTNVWGRSFLRLSDLDFKAAARDGFAEGGQGATSMSRLYQLLSTEGQFFATSWDREPSGQLPLMFGESYGIGPFVPHLETLPLPPVPTSDYLRLHGDWHQENARRLELAWKFLGENDELEALLYTNLPAVEFTRYNLEVYLSISRLCRQNLLLLKDLETISRDLETAEDQAAKLHYEIGRASCRERV